MSRTTKDQPYRVRANNAPPSQTEEWHYGCENDPEGRKRYVRTKTEIIDRPPYWHQKEVVVGHTLWGEDITALRWVFEGEHIENKVRIYETVPCDIDSPDTTSRQITCSRDPKTARHHCHWPKGGRRAYWYGPEREDERMTLRQMAQEYNTHGDIETDEPWTPGSPRGMWGGGWID